MCFKKPMPLFFCLISRFNSSVNFIEVFNFMELLLIFDRAKYVVLYRVLAEQKSVG